MINHLEQREIFHLIFLKEFIRRVKPGSYALKGGCNLRFFFNSIRYSEDMDIDIAGIEIFKLKEIVMELLVSSKFSAALRTYQIERVVPPELKSAKQTETVQRFKAHLLNSAGEDLFTKIEFSRRGPGVDAVTGPVNDAVLRHYKLAPLVLTHYSARSAIRQKIEALAGRTSVQARDVFDIYFLSSQIDEGQLAKVRGSLSGAKLKAAGDALLSLNFGNFGDMVLGYLNEEDRAQYSEPQMWDDIQLKVAGIITGGDK